MKNILAFFQVLLIIMLLVASIYAIYILAIVLAATALYYIISAFNGYKEETEAEEDKGGSPF
jgi:hypothetical protein